MLSLSHLFKVLMLISGNFILAQSLESNHEGGGGR